MQTPQAPQTALPPAWTKVLEQVQQALEQTAADAGAREQLLLDMPALSVTAGTSAGREQLVRFSDVMAGATQRAGEAEALLASAEADLRGWLSRVRANAQNLADWLEREV